MTKFRRPTAMTVIVCGLIVLLLGAITAAKVYGQQQLADVLITNRPQKLSAFIPADVPADDRAVLRWYGQKVGDTEWQLIAEHPNPVAGVADELTIMRADSTGAWLWSVLLFDQAGNPSEWSQSINDTPIEPGPDNMPYFHAAGMLTDENDLPQPIRWDTNFNMADVIVARENVEAADVDGDGDVDAVDIQLVINAALGV